MLSGYAKLEWLTILGIGALLTLAFAVIGWWLLAILMVLATFAVLTFFRDPDRRPPVQRGVFVSPADGRVSSVHRVEHYEPFDGPAMCIRVFLSVLDVHVQRSPCHGVVASVTHKPGQYLNALNPQSAEVNESVTMVLVHPIRRHPIAAVRQVSGLLARTIVCGVEPDTILQRGQRYGIIKLGSTAELYIPETLGPKPAVERGAKVKAGVTILFHTIHREDENPIPAASSKGDATPG
jgi:phosphatidylserine decarboxylase